MGLFYGERINNREDEALQKTGSKYYPKSG